MVGHEIHKRFSQAIFIDEHLLKKKKGETVS